MEQEYQRSSRLLEENLAKRGMATSGVMAEGLTDLEEARMLGIANVKVTAPHQVAQAQQDFLRIGMGQGQNLQQGISNIYGQQAQTQRNLAGQYGAQAQQAASGIGQSIGTGVSSYLQYQAWSA